MNAEKPPALKDLCACKDRLKADCPGEWEPGCDLGNNAAFVRVDQQTLEEVKATDAALGSRTST